MNLKKEVYFLLLIAFIFFAAGCDKYTNYKVLSFFFTGVPHPDEQPELSVMTAQTSFQDTEKRTVAVSSTHGPYAAKQCFLCHEASTAPSRTTTGFNIPLPGGILSPVKQLCIECHPTKSMQSAFTKKLWVHGPVATGFCTVCHNPHASNKSYMLVSNCSMCHTAGVLSQSEDHIEGKKCISCHNAHLGKDRFLLKKDFEEVY